MTTITANQVHSHSVVARREISASPEDVFDAWLDPEALSIWMRPPGATATRSQVDARVGGSYEIVMQHGADLIHHRGIYREITRPSRLVFTWRSPVTEPLDTLVTVEFNRRGSATEVVITHQGLPSAESARLHAEGWAGALEVLRARIGEVLARTR